MQLKKKLQTFSKHYHGSVIDRMSENELKHYSKVLNWRIRIFYWFFLICKATGFKADKLRRHILFLYEVCVYVHFAYKRKVARRLIKESPILQKYIAMGVIRNDEGPSDRNV
ncbi:hypothetical protein GO495_19890 [Chitinophaga oryziterrae]|uniref:Uncharacterized protein n=1 Tax=Chitinophaga oryziterrae TaxID=1031224 RepID=A0A6N8JC89_9BACT|nr:hypothetical protein [Chitinophaga oryziterrae]MVT42867.1 hypothetical protein [Chitinophaga oryziterrae]